MSVFAEFGYRSLGSYTLSKQHIDRIIELDPQITAEMPFRDPSAEIGVEQGPLFAYLCELYDELKNNESSDEDMGSEDYSSEELQGEDDAQEEMENEGYCPEESTDLRSDHEPMYGTCNAPLRRFTV